MEDTFSTELSSWSAGKTASKKRMVLGRVYGPNRQVNSTNAKFELNAVSLFRIGGKFAQIGFVCSSIDAVARYNNNHA